MVKTPGQFNLPAGNAPLPKAGRWEARTGGLRFVNRKVAFDETIPPLILQQEYAVITRDNHGIESRSFEWQDVPTVEEG